MLAFAFVVSCNKSGPKTEDAITDKQEVLSSQASEVTNKDNVANKAVKTRQIEFQGIKLATSIGCNYRVLLKSIANNLVHIMGDEIVGDGKVRNLKVVSSVPESFNNQNCVISFSVYSDKMKLDSTYDEKLKRYLLFNKPVNKCIMPPETTVFKLLMNEKTVSVP